MRNPEARSRITNGRDLLPGVDGRSVWARRLRDLVELHIADQGGREECTEARRSLLRRAAVLEVEAEYLEAQMAERKASDKQLDLYLRIVGALKSVHESLGLERRARDVIPALGDYLAAQESENG